MVFCYTSNLRSFIISSPLDYETNTDQDAEYSGVKVYLPVATADIDTEQLAPSEIYSEKLREKVGNNFSRYIKSTKYVRRAYEIADRLLQMEPSVSVNNHIMNPSWPH